LTGDWANRPLSLFGRNAASGTYGFFKEHALKNGDFKTTVKEQPGSSSVVQGVENDRYGIGYSGIGYRTAGVKLVPLSETATSPVSDGSYADVQSGKYPLWRYLLVYVNKAPGKPLAPLTQEFVKFIYSKEGQEAVVKDGYMPLSAAQAAAEVGKILK
jgi:phosphate transport system substrate-binding protein